ncbi:MAG TPA: 3'-5' exonuclease [Gemmatimonadaceae bacterium]
MGLTSRALSGPQRYATASSGAAELALLEPSSPLLDRAREFLARGPAFPESLIAYVCQLPGAPRHVADHMAVALFEGSREFTRAPDGRWSMVREQPPAWPRPAVRRLDDLTFVVVDVETTGSSPWLGDRVTEVAAVVVQGGEIRDQWETLVNPQRAIPPRITALTRITSAMVERAPTFSAIAGEVGRVLGGRLFVAHNAAFDWRFLSIEMQRATGARLTGERLCTVRLARAILPQLRRRSLDALSHYYGVENHARHRAGGDALATAKILIRLLAGARDRGCETLDDLRELTRPAPRRHKRRRALPKGSDGDFSS